jgi:hypothetical protein
VIQNPKILVFLLLSLAGMALFTLSAGVRAFESRIDEGEYQYHTGSALLRTRARTLDIPDD